MRHLARAPTIALAVTLVVPAVLVRRAPAADDVKIALVTETVTHMAQQPPTGCHLLRHRPPGDDGARA
jgi:hypothetical protein